MRPSHCDVSLVRLGGWWALGRLARSTAGEDIKWNFGKFLVSNGSSIKRSLHFFFASLSRVCAHVHALWLCVALFRFRQQIRADHFAQSHSAGYRIGHQPRTHYVVSTRAGE